MGVCGGESRAESKSNFIKARLEEEEVVIVFPAAASFLTNTDKSSHDDSSTTLLRRSFPLGVGADAGEKDDDADDNEANGVDADGIVVEGGDEGLSRLMLSWRWRNRKWSRPFSS